MPETIDLRKTFEIMRYMPIEQYDDVCWLAHHARGCKRILELGTYLGCSTRAMLDNSDADIWCVDAWQGSGRSDQLQTTENDYQAFWDNMKDVSDRVVVFKMFTREAVDLVAKLPLFDMVFIDADHCYESIKFDIMNYANFVRPGGLLCGHDYGPLSWQVGLVRAVHELIANPKLAAKWMWWAIREEGWLLF